MFVKDYHFELGDPESGAVFKWTVRARNPKEAVNVSRRFLEERLNSQYRELQVEVEGAEEGVVRENPEVPGDFRVEIDPRKIGKQHAVMESDPVD